MTSDVSLRLADVQDKYGETSSMTGDTRLKQLFRRAEHLKKTGFCWKKGDPPVKSEGNPPVASKGDQPRGK